MKKAKRPTKGYSYRFDLSSSDTTAADVMLTVWAAGRFDKEKAVDALKKHLKEFEDGMDLNTPEGTSYGRVYFHSKEVRAGMIVDYYEQSYA